MVSWRSPIAIKLVNKRIEDRTEFNKNVFVVETILINEVIVVIVTVVARSSVTMATL